MKIIFTLLLLQINWLLFGQTTLKGHIHPSENFANKLYIFKLSQIDPHPPIIYDSIQMLPNGTFEYHFRNTSPQDLIYKVFIPLKHGNPFHTFGTINKNYLFITTEGNEVINLSASADSLFYSANVTGGKINAQLQAFTKMQKGFYTLEKVMRDSVQKNPSREFEYKQQMMSKWMGEVERAKQKVITVLDTARTTSIVLFGLEQLYEANFGMLDSTTAAKYLQRITNHDLLIVRNIQALTRKTQSNRLNIILPNIPLSTTSGKKQNLYDFKDNYILIDFWASWCSPCRYANKNETPALHKKYKDKLTLIGVSIDSDLKKWKTAVSKDATSWNQYIDRSYILQKQLQLYGVPVYILIDKDHKIVFESIALYQMDQYLEDLFNR